jgi:ribosomal protein L11 methylase PrmA
MEPDWSINEFFAPVWLSEKICTCAEGVEVPSHDGTLAIELSSSNSFGSGGHPATKAAFDLLYQELLSQKASNLFFNTKGKIRYLLDIDSGTGLFPIFAKIVNPEIKTVAVIHRKDRPAIISNMIRNKVQIDQIVLFDEFCDRDYLEFHRKFFDVVITQRGTQRAGISPAQAFSIIFDLLKDDGRVIFSGYPTKAQRYVSHIMGEFFRDEKISIAQGWPAITGERF